MIIKELRVDKNKYFNVLLIMFGRKCNRWGISWGFKGLDFGFG